VSLTVRDLEKSVQWYTEGFGFVVDQRNERDGKVVSVSLRAGDVRIRLNQDDGGKGWERQKGQGCSFYLITNQEVDTVANRLRAAGTTLVTEPADMPWGVRAFRVMDPDGFAFAVARPL